MDDVFFDNLVSVKFVTYFQRNKMLSMIWCYSDKYAFFYNFAIAYMTSYIVKMMYCVL